MSGCTVPAAVLGKTLPHNHQVSRPVLYQLSHQGSSAGWVKSPIDVQGNAILINRHIYNNNWESNVAWFLIPYHCVDYLY